MSALLLALVSWLVTAPAQPFLLVPSLPRPHSLANSMPFLSSLPAPSAVPLPSSLLSQTLPSSLPPHDFLPSSSLVSLQQLDFSNPVKDVFLAYVVFSLLAGAKGLLDGWRPDFRSGEDRWPPRGGAQNGDAQNGDASPPADAAPPTDASPPADPPSPPPPDPPPPPPPKSALDSLNEFLDKPLLDTGKRGGPLEPFKRFARREPEQAQVAASVVTFLTFATIGRLLLEVVRTI